MLAIPRSPVVDHFGFPREAVGWMMYYVDRVSLLQTRRRQRPSPPCRAEAPAAAAAAEAPAAAAAAAEQREFLLLSLTSFYLAVKLACNPSRGGGGAGTGGSGTVGFPIMSAVLAMSKNQFTAGQVAETERRILEELGYRVHPPTPDRYLLELVEVCCRLACPRDRGGGGGGGGGEEEAIGTLRLQRERVHDYSLYLVELSVLDHFFLRYRPSEIAVAALYGARDAAAARGSSEVGEGPDAAAEGPRPAVVFAADPLRAMAACLRPGARLDPARVASCRARFGRMIRQQAEQQQQQNLAAAALPGGGTPSKPISGDGDGGGSAVLRTVSPVSVHPRDPANCPGAAPRRHPKAEGELSRFRSTNNAPS
jgi:hypothetical protein